MKMPEIGLCGETRLPRNDVPGWPKSGDLETDTVWGLGSNPGACLADSQLPHWSELRKLTPNTLPGRGTEEIE